MSIRTKYFSSPKTSFAICFAKYVLPVPVLPKNIKTEGLSFSPKPTRCLLIALHTSSTASSCPMTFSLILSFNPFKRTFSELVKSSKGMSIFSDNNTQTSFFVMCVGSFDRMSSFSISPIFVLTDICFLTNSSILSYCFVVEEDLIVSISSMMSDNSSFKAINFGLSSDCMLVFAPTISNKSNADSGNDLFLIYFFESSTQLVMAKSSYTTS